MSNPSDPNITTGGVDLSHLKDKPVDFAERDAQRAADEAREAQEAVQRQARAQVLAAEAQRAEQDAQIQQVAASWDRNMQRAFKGIIRRDVRHAYLQKGLAA